jgi:hypothetical protein
VAGGEIDRLADSGEKSGMKTNALVLTALAMSVAACSSLPGLSTSSITGGTEKAKAPVPQGPVAVTDPLRRAIKIAETSARAEKCGYNFDPARLRANYLASEAQQGLDAASSTKLTATYDLARQTTWREIANDDDYCTAARTAAIKTSLTKVLANDFTVVEEKKGQDGLWGSFASNTQDKLNPNWAQNPAFEKMTTKATPRPVE